MIRFMIQDRTKEKVSRFLFIWRGQLACNAFLLASRFLLPISINDYISNVAFVTALMWCAVYKYSVLHSLPLRSLETLHQVFDLDHLREGDDVFLRGLVDVSL